MYLINQNNFIQNPPNDVHVNHLHHLITSNQCNNQLNNHQFSNQPTSNLYSNFKQNVNHQTNLYNNHLTSNLNNSASFNCIVSNKVTPTAHQLIPHHSATNLTTANNSQLLCFNCKNHAHPHSNNPNTKLSNSNTSLTNGQTNLSLSNIYNRNKLEQSLIEAKLRVAQLKKELNQSSKQTNSNQYLSSLNSVNSQNCLNSQNGLNNLNQLDDQDQVDFGLGLNTCETSRESQIRMLKNYMQEVNSVHNSQNNSNQQLALPLINKSGSSISTDSLRNCKSLRNSTSSIHLNHILNNHQPGNQLNNHQSNNQLNNHYLNNHLNINHSHCNHQVSTSDSCATENIYSNQLIINSLNKSKGAKLFSKSANTINLKSSNNISSPTVNQSKTNLLSNENLSNHNNLSNDNLNINSRHLINSSINSPTRTDNQIDLMKARQRVIQLKKDFESNSENYVIYTNQTAILAQKKEKLELNQKINDININNNQTQPIEPRPIQIEDGYNVLSIIDKYLRKNDNSTAVEV